MILISPFKGRRPVKEPAFQDHDLLSKCQTILNLFGRSEFPIKGYIETNLGLYCLMEPEQVLVNREAGTLTLRYPALHVRRRVVIRHSYFVLRDMLLKKREHQIVCRRGDTFKMSNTLGVTWA